MDLILRNSRIKLSQGQIFWRETGEGATVVFLHGSWYDSSQWLPILKPLSVDHHCFAPDLLGFGDSEHPNIHYSIELEIECLAEYLEALNLPQVYLVAHSLGAWIAVSFALKHIDKINGIVLLSPEGLQTDIRKKYGFWTQLLLSNPPLLFWLLLGLQPISKFLGLQPKINHLIQLRQKLIKNPTACQLLWQRRQAEIQAELLTDKLDYLKVPVLILQGKQDTVDAIAQSEAYAKLVSNSELIMINQEEKDLIENKSDVVADYIRKFIISC